jgi:hypothetical protein
MEFIAITNHPTEARVFEQCRIDRIMVDLEVLGKVERQKGRPTWISDHQPEDVSALRKVLQRSALLVRINPIHAGSKAEIDDVIDRGADIVMLPMATSVEEIKRFVEYVAGRRRSCLLLETAAALAEAVEIAAMPGLDEIHVGLNDLHLTLGMRSMFEVLSDGRLDSLAQAVASSGKKLGIGGIGMLGAGEIAPSLILGEHVRLGSSMVILSRSFFAGLNRGGDPALLAALAPRVSRLREHVDYLAAMPTPELAGNRARLKANVETFLSRRQA